MKKRFGVHPDVLKLGLVSFLTDVSSEMIFSVFAIFFTTIAGASTALLGLVEGLADFSASSLDYIAGYLSDRSGKRKIFATFGYAFSTVAKLILAFANSVFMFSAFRIVERLGKSFRGPPRDAWLAGVAERKNRGFSFGVHKALDKAGAVLGPLIAYVILSVYGDSSITFRWLFVVALIPAFLSVAVLLLIKDKPGKQYKRENIFAAWKTLSPGFKRYMVAAGLFSLAYFSFSFLLLRAYDLGFSVKDVVLLYALFNISFVVAAPFVGRLGDHIGRKKIVILGYLTYLVMSLGFAFANARWQIFILFIIFGFFYSIDEAQSKAFIADVEKKRRATAIGVYNFVTGIIYLPASLIAGLLWALHPSIVFLFAALLSLVAINVFIIIRPERA